MQCVPVLRLGLYPHVLQYGLQVLRFNILLKNKSAEIQHFVEKQNAFEK